MAAMIAQSAVVDRRAVGAASRELSDPANDPAIVVILGPTGVGKSQLAVEIAAEINGEVISADALQV